MTMTAAMAEALTDRRPVGLLVEIEHPAGTAYFRTGVGSRTWNGHVFTGVGNLGSITPIKQSSEIAIQDIVFRLDGVSADMLSRLDGDVRNRTGTYWLACFDSRDDIIADPFPLGSAALDYQTLTINNDGEATIEITAHAGFYTLDRGVDEAWTPENQKLTYPTDTGLDMIPSLQKQDIQWTPVAS